MKQLVVEITNHHMVLMASKNEKWNQKDECHIGGRIGSNKHHAYRKNVNRYTKVHLFHLVSVLGIVSFMRWNRK